MMPQKKRSPDDGAPLAVGVLRAKTDGEFPGCFPNDLKTTDERGLKGFV